MEAIHGLYRILSWTRKQHKDITEGEDNSWNRFKVQKEACTDSYKTGETCNTTMYRSGET